MIELDRIEPDPEQPRKQQDTAAQQELTASVKRHGLLQPITVRYIEAKQVYRIVSGERRYLAAREARLSEVPCWVRTPNDNEILSQQIIENWQRADMHPYDLADAIARLRDANGYTQTDLAREIGKSEGEISKLLAMLKLDPDVQQLARQGESSGLTRGHLYALTRVEASQQLELADRIRQGRLTVSAAEQLVATALNPARKRGAPVTRFRFPTEHAKVTVLFRKKDVNPGDVLAALE